MLGPVQTWVSHWERPHWITCCTCCTACVQLLSWRLKSYRTLINTSIRFCNYYCSAIFHLSNLPSSDEKDEKWADQWDWKKLLTDNKTDQLESRRKSVYTRPPQSVQGDCFGELRKVNWNRLSLFKHRPRNVTTAGRRFYTKLSSGAALLKWQHLF